jgi:diacylglycerol kinase family enzyme
LAETAFSTKSSKISCTQNHGVVCLPFGTGNDFSRAIHRQMSPEAILKATLDQPAIPIDTILVNDERYCVNVGCFGLDALIA